MRLFMCGVLLVLASGCAHNRQYFRPTERVRGQTVHGYHEAFYDLVGPRGPFGEAKVWTIGAYRSGDDSVLEVSLELHNTSAQPISVAASDVRLDPVRVGRSVLRDLRPQETGTFQVKPEGRGEMKLHFLLPKGITPGHVTSFALLWRAQNVDQSYAQKTPFREENAYYPPRDMPYPYPYYSSIYPCSPYDIHCVGSYWPYEPRHSAPAPSGRKRVDVGK